MLGYEIKFAEITHHHNYNKAQHLINAIVQKIML